MANGQRDVRSEVMDLLSLTGMINSDIQEANKGVVYPESSRLVVNKVNPKVVAETFINTTAAGVNLSPTAIAQAINPPPMATATFDGVPVEVAPPRGFIPLPDGYRMPSIPNAAPQVNPAPANPPPTMVQPPQMIQPEAVQMELGLVMEAPQNKSILAEIFLRFKRIEDKMDVLNGKMNELLTMERKKYERRIKKSTEGLGRVSEDTPNPQ